MTLEMRLKYCRQSLEHAVPYDHSWPDKLSLVGDSVLCRELETVRAGGGDPGQVAGVGYHVP